jgi:hypothetical protein
MPTPINLITMVKTDRSVRRYVILGVVLSVLQFILFKLLYPFPDFFSDSYSYIFAADAHLDVSIWPIGYSKFLSAAHLFTHSDTALVAVQYFLMQLSVLYFYLTVYHLFQLTRVSRNVLFAFLFLDPLTLSVQYH